VIMLGIFIALVIIVGAGFVWAIFFGHSLFDGFWTLFALVVAEPVGILFLWARNVLGLRTPQGRKMTFTSQGDINDYMKRLIESGSAVDIVSGRLSWVRGDQEVENAIVTHSSNAAVTIFLPANNDISKRLTDRGVRITITPLLTGGPKARFTLVNKDRPGSGLLAVGFGNLPSFEISEFPEPQYPQIVALARDYIAALSA